MPQFLNAELDIVKNTYFSKESAESKFKVSQAGHP